MGIWECEISLKKVLLLLISPQFRFISVYKIQNSLIGKPFSVFAERSSRCSQEPNSQPCISTDYSVTLYSHIL